MPRIISCARAAGPGLPGPVAGHSRRSIAARTTAARWALGAGWAGWASCASCSISTGWALGADCSISTGWALGAGWALWTLGAGWAGRTGGAGWPGGAGGTFDTFAGSRWTLGTLGALGAGWALGASCASCSSWTGQALGHQLAGPVDLDRNLNASRCQTS